MVGRDYGKIIMRLVSRARRLSAVLFSTKSRQLRESSLTLGCPDCADRAGADEEGGSNASNLKPFRWAERQGIGRMKKAR
jgi:hypothetical protein